MRKAISLLLIILLSTLHFSFRTNPVRAWENIYIRADGSIDPPTVPISTIDNITYTFNDNIFNSTLILEKSNTVIDGNGYGLYCESLGNEVGLWINDLSNVTVTDLTIKNYDRAVVCGGLQKSHIFRCNFVGGPDRWTGLIGTPSETTISKCNFSDYTAAALVSGNHNLISGNFITNNRQIAIAVDGGYNVTITRNLIISNGYGIFLGFRSHNEIISYNEIVSNGIGVFFFESSNTTLYHNNFINSTHNQVYVSDDNYLNHLDNGCEGNYWSDYEERYPDASYDEFGIWNMSYVIDGNNSDNYPVRNPYWNPADINHDLKIDIFDVVLVANYYLTPWGPNYCHIDVAEPYGIINIFDIVMICSSYGEAY